jgi:hypothetical protein
VKAKMLAVILVLGLVAPAPVILAPCSAEAACSGCGCRGGPGWRSKRTGKCVGWDDLARECGNPPDPARCTKEN